MASTDTTQDRLAGTWHYNAVHSTANFSVQYLVAQFRGEFTDLTATFADGKLTGAVKVDSIAVKDENLTAHLLGPDFFDAESHPEISFASDSLTYDGDQVTLDGQLTVKGTTKPVQAKGTVSGPTEDFMGNTRIGFTLETVIDRDAYGVSWNADLPKGGKALGNDVTLVVELEFHKA